MTVVSINNNEDSHGGHLSHRVTDTPSKKAPSSGGPDPLILAYMAIFEAVQINNQSAQVTAKQLQANAYAQSKKIAEENAMNFVLFRWSQLFSRRLTLWLKQKPNGGPTYVIKNYRIVSKKMGNQTLDNFQSQNQEVSAIRAVMEDQISLLRQSGQIYMTNENTTIDEGQQAIQEGSSLAQMLASLTNQIARV